MAREETFKTELSRRLRAIRKAMGDPTRDEFAERLGVSAKTLGNYERGDNVPDANVLAAYRRISQVDLNLLMGDAPLQILQATTGAEKTGLAVDALRQLPDVPKQIVCVVDADRLRAAIEAVEEGLAGRQIASPVKAELTVAAYDLLTMATEESRATVIRLVKGA